MENEQAPTSYEVPTGLENFSAEQADSALKKIYADAGENVKHPYCNAVHPQSKDFRAAVEKLHQIKNPQPLEEKSPSEKAVTPKEFLQALSAEKFGPKEIKAMSAGLEIVQGTDKETQEKLRVDIEKEIKQINDVWGENGVGKAEASENPTPERLEGYRQMRLLAQGNYTGLGPQVISDFQKLGMPKEQLDVIRQFFTVVIPGDNMSQDLANLLIKHSFKGKMNRKENPSYAFGEPGSDQRRKAGTGEQVDSDYDRTGQSPH